MRDWKRDLEFNKKQTKKRRSSSGDRLFFIRYRLPSNHCRLPSRRRRLFMMCRRFLSRCRRLFMRRCRLHPSRIYYFIVTFDPIFSDCLIIFGLPIHSIRLAPLASASTDSLAKTRALLAPLASTVTLVVLS